MSCIHIIKWLVRIVAYPFLSVYFRLFPLNVQVQSLEDCVSMLSSGRKSLVRYGDGEIKLMDGSSIYYQPYDKKLAEQLVKIMSFQDGDFLIGMSDVFDRLNDLVLFSRIFWKSSLFLHQSRYRSLPYRLWANTFLSRPYIDYKNKDKKAFFIALRKLWEDRNVVLVEGETTRNGVGNDLYENAKSVRRIVCPASNAYAVYEEVEAYILSSIDKDSLILLSLGPAAKVIVYDLFLSGFQAMDIGHIDSEYEWFCRGENHRQKLEGKHSAEYADSHISDCTDKTYQSQIIARFPQLKINKGQ